MTERHTNATISGGLAFRLNRLGLGERLGGPAVRVENLQTQPVSVTIVYNYYCRIIARYVIEKTVTYQLCLVCIIQSRIVKAEITT